VARAALARSPATTESDEAEVDEAEVEVRKALLRRIDILEAEVERLRAPTESEGGELRDLADSRDRWMSLACKELPDAYDRYDAALLWKDEYERLRAARAPESEGACSACGAALEVRCGDCGCASPGAGEGE